MPITKTTVPNENSVGGKLLVATPALNASCFAHSVIYMCNHDAKGAMGLIINHMLEKITAKNVFKQFNLPDAGISVGNMPIHFGGPVDMLRGFILHSPDYITQQTHVVNDMAALSSNIKMLRDILEGRGPKKHILALGYAGWTEGQLENEIRTGSWITVPATEDILFDTTGDDTWKRALKAAGIEDPLRFSSQVGHA